MWQPIETAPEEENVLIYGVDLYGKNIITGARKTKYGWDVLGVGGCECETEIVPSHWMLPTPPINP